MLIELLLKVVEVIFRQPGWHWIPGGSLCEWFERHNILLVDLLGRAQAHERLLSRLIRGLRQTDVHPRHGRHTARMLMSNCRHLYNVGVRIMLSNDCGMNLALGTALPGVSTGEVLRLNEDDIAGMGWDKFMCCLLFHVGAWLSAPFIFSWHGGCQDGRENGADDEEELETHCLV